MNYLLLALRSRIATTALLAFAVFFAALATPSCGGSATNDTPDATGSDLDGGADSLTTFQDAPSSTFDASKPTIHTSYACDGCAPFPPESAPECPQGALTPPAIAYPPSEVLFPPNLNVLEVQFTKPTSATLFEVSFENAVTDVRVETPCIDVPNVRGGASLGCGVTLPAQAWKDIADTNRDGDPVNVIVRATADGKCVSKSQGTVRMLFAGADVTGGIYYWQSAVYGGAPGRTGGIYSHDFGAADPTPTPFYESGTSGTCVGCHNLSRDGERISLGIDDPDADDEFWDVSTQAMDVKTRAPTAGGATIAPGFQTWAHDHSRLIATSFDSSSTGNSTFAFYDGDGTSLLASAPISGGLQGTQPDLSADDKNLVFVVPANGTISQQGDHHFTGGSLYVASVDLSHNSLGNAAPLLPAPAGGNEAYYYPSFSPDGRFVIFNHATTGDVYYNRTARVQMIHYPLPANGAPLDLAALNGGDGLTNSWPRWSPFVQSYRGRKLLWVTFSSNRDYGLHIVNKGFDNYYPPASPDYDQPQLDYSGGFEKCAQPQIWMAAVLVDQQGEFDVEDRSFPAFWLPFQDVNSHNHSAQWVEKVLNPASPDGGTCGKVGDSCNSQPCCSDVVCCKGTCQTTCIN